MFRLWPGMRSKPVGAPPTFTPPEVVSVISPTTQDGESNWMEGVLLLAVYAILGLTFFWIPG